MIDKFSPSIIVNYPIVKIAGKTSTVKLTIRTMLMLEQKYETGFIDLFERLRGDNIDVRFLVEFIYHMLDPAVGITMADIAKLTDDGLSDLVKRGTEALVLSMPVSRDDEVEEEREFVFNYDGGDDGIDYVNLLYFALSTLGLSEEAFYGQTLRSINSLINAHKELNGITSDDNETRSII